MVAASGAETGAGSGKNDSTGADHTYHTKSLAEMCNLTRDQVPKLFREEHVIGGFREPYQPIGFYLSSLFTLHNESMNVWTHLVSAAILSRELTCAPPGISPSSRLYLPYFLFLVSAVGYMLTSALAHLLHPVSRPGHYLAFYLDFFAISHYCFTSANMFFFYSSTDQIWHQYSGIYVHVTLLLSCAVSYGCVYAKFKFTRPYPVTKKYIICGTIGMLYTWNIFPVAGRIWADGAADTMPHIYHIVAFVVAVWFYSSGFPQSRMAGKCDLLLHGHQIFHVFIAITTFLQVQALKEDMLEVDRSREKCVEFVALLCVLFLFSSFTVIHFYHKIKRVLDKSSRQ